MQYDFVIVGAGIVGLLSARKLAKKGFSVAILDKGRVGGESSWAGGGIIAPIYPWDFAFSDKAAIEFGQAYYPKLQESLLNETGLDIEWNPCGLLVLDKFEPDNIESLIANKVAHYSFFSQLVLPSLFPALSRQLNGGLFFPHIGNIRNPQLIKVLHYWLMRQKTVDFFEYSTVEKIQVKDNKIEAVFTKEKAFSAANYLFSAGAWTGELLKKIEVNLPIFPIQGQMLQIQAKPDFLSCMVVSDGKYIIPRKDGKLLIGSTVEDVGFKKKLTSSAYESLSHFAEKLLPDIKKYPVIAHWCGLRPAMSGGVYVGKIADYSNAVVASGHFRLGLTLAPFAANQVAQIFVP